MVGARHLGRVHMVKKVSDTSEGGLHCKSPGGKEKINPSTNERQVNFKRIRRKRRLGRASTSATPYYRMCIYVKFILATLES